MSRVAASRGSASIGAVIFGSALFAVAISTREVINPWWTHSIVAAVVIPLVVWLRHARPPREAYRPSALALSAALGGALVGATHVAYRLAVQLIPSIEDTVAVLYGNIGDEPLGQGGTVIFIAMVVVAEELLWRGLLFDWVKVRLGRAEAAAAAVVGCALPQVVGGELVLVAMALVTGAVFACQRALSEGVTAPIVTHAVWSVGMFSLFPLHQ